MIGEVKKVMVLVHDDDVDTVDIDTSRTTVQIL